MRKEIFYGIRFTLIGMVVFGAMYHAGVWGIGNSVFQAQAAGSLVYVVDGTPVGSELIAQAFSRPEYFHPRPSAVGYNAASTGGSNYGPSNPEHLALVATRIAEVAKREQVSPAAIPSEMVTASGAGLDPHLPVAAVLLQVPRVAAARGLDEQRIRQVVAASVEGRWLGLFGAPRINVLRLNLALDNMAHRRPEGA